MEATKGQALHRELQSEVEAFRQMQAGHPPPPCLCRPASPACAAPPLSQSPELGMEKLVSALQRASFHPPPPLTYRRRRRSPTAAADDPPADCPPADVQNNHRVRQQMLQQKHENEMVLQASAGTGLRELVPLQAWPRP